MITCKDIYGNMIAINPHCIDLVREIDENTCEAIINDVDIRIKINFARLIKMIDVAINDMDDGSEIICMN